MSLQLMRRPGVIKKIAFCFDPPLTRRAPPAGPMKTLRSSSFAVSGPLLVAAALSAGGVSACSIASQTILAPSMTSCRSRTAPASSVSFQGPPEPGRWQDGDMADHAPRSRAHAAEPERSHRRLGRRVGLRAGQHGEARDQQHRSGQHVPCADDPVLLRQRHPAPFLREPGFNNVYSRSPRSSTRTTSQSRPQRREQRFPRRSGSKPARLWLYTSDAYVPNAPKSGISTSTSPVA